MTNTQNLTPAQRAAANAAAKIQQRKAAKVIDRIQAERTADQRAAAEVAELLAAGNDHLDVTVTPQGWVDIHVPVDRQLDSAATLDFLRVIADDGTFTLHHLSHNGLIKGSSTFKGSFVGFLYGVVSDFFATL